MHKSASIKN